MRTTLIVAAVVLSTSIGGVHAQAVPPKEKAPAPATQPVDPKIQTLIKQLGDDDTHKRDAAMDALRKLGADALPGLRVAMQNDDPQIRLSAESLVAEQREKDNPRPRQANVQVPDGGIILNGGQIVVNGVRANGIGGQFQVRMNAAGGARHSRDMTSNTNGHVVHIHEDNDSVKVEVTDNGETKTYEAKTVAELKEKQPDGFKVYEQYMKNGPAIRFEVPPQ